MNRKGILALFAALVLGLGTFAVAQGNLTDAPKHGAGMRRHFGQRMATELGLTDQQKTQIKQILENEKPKVQPLRDQLRNEHQQMAALTKDGAFDEAQVRNIANQQAQTQANLIVERQRVKSEIYQLLTPDQRTKADQMKAQLGQRMHRGFRGQQAQPPTQQK
jgi:Spy/CpxP family protein refolding chaperone